MSGKIATKKTAGILADDLAINADKASGFTSNRELPVLWKISKGSFLNKLIIFVCFACKKGLPCKMECSGSYTANCNFENIFRKKIQRAQ